MEVLADCFGQFAREVLDCQPAFQELEALFDAPALMIERHKLGGGVCGRILPCQRATGNGHRLAPPREQQLIERTER